MKYLLAALLISSGELAPTLANEETFDEQKNWHQASKKINKYKKHLESSIWIVPPPTSFAYSHVDGLQTASSDQTVWVIDQFENGYFFGDAYVSINQNSFSHLHLIGSLTPTGGVNITFYQTNGEFKQLEVVTGIGKFKKIDGQYVFVMEMNGPNDEASRLAPQSFMINVNKGDYFYEHLPGKDMSLPEFLSQFSK